MVGVRSALAVGPFSDEVIVGGIIVLAAGFFGAFTLYRGLKEMGRAYSIFSHDPVDAGSVHLESDVVEVQGEAEPVDDVLTGTYTGAECLAYKYKKKRKKRNTNSDGNTETKWRTVDQGGAKTSFYVTDDTGKVAVEPTGSSLSVNMDLVERTGREKKYEGRLDSGETVHVYGQKLDAAADGGAPGEETVFIGDGDDEDSTFTISDTTENRTILRYTAKGLVGVIAGTFVLAFATTPILAYNDLLEPTVEFVSSVLPFVIA